jgi:hypothetical protein
MADGYADPGPGKPTRPGAYMHAEFGIPVIGVAKTGFRTATHAVPILLGPPRTGVTAAGMRRGDAAELVRLMADRSGYLTRCAAPISSPARGQGSSPAEPPAISERCWRPGE